MAGQDPGVRSASPRCIASRPAPRRFTATRAVGPICVTERFWLCSERTVTACSPSTPRSTIRSPVRSVPAVSVPVTTVPAPEMVKARSIHSRTRAVGSGSGTSRSTASSASRNASSPVPRCAETTTAGASASPVPASSERAREMTASTRSGARSALVTTISPWVIPRAATASRWSPDCSCQPSSAATTKHTTGAGPTPASMLPRNLSWPGTSTNATCVPEGSSVHAKPRSMVSPRCFSSSQRSGSMPVSARTRVLLPWST